LLSVITELSETGIYTVITESNRPLDAISGIEKNGVDNGYLAVKIMQGSYKFAVEK
jgi:hypothetical protein